MKFTVTTLRGRNNLPGVMTHPTDSVFWRIFPQPKTENIATSFVLDFSALCNKLALEQSNDMQSIPVIILRSWLVEIPDSVSEGISKCPTNIVKELCFEARCLHNNQHISG